MHPALVALVRTALADPGAFYRDRLQAAGIGDAGRLDTDAWQRLAPTSRAELVVDQLANLPHGSRRRAAAAAPVRAGASGSGSDLLVLSWTKDDLAHERRAGVRSLQALGIAPPQRVANALPGALATPGSLLLGDVVDDLGALDVPLGSVRDEAGARAAWKLIDRIEANVLVVDAASALPLFAHAPAAARPWWHGVVTLLTPETAGAPPAPVPASLGFAGWQRFWLAVPEAACFVAVSCAAGALHVDAGVTLEIAAPESGAPVAPGSVGEVLLTPHDRDQLLLRFRTGLHARTVACACGNPAPAIEPD